MINSFNGPNRFLSNFYPVHILGPSKLIYPSVEHAYQASKTDDKNTHMILANDELSAGHAKRIGRTVAIKHDFNKNRTEIMLKLIRKKFAFNPLRQKLLDTGNQQLIEGNYWNDTFWGICNGRGQNHLGEILMKVRTEIRTEISK